MTAAARVVPAPVWAAVWLAMFAPAASGAIDENETVKRHVGINVYAGDELARTATGVVIGPGVVLADAETVSRGRRHAVVSTGGAEIAASVSHADRALSLAVLEVPGLDQPGLPFALAEVGANEDRFVHSVSYDPTAIGALARFVFLAGTIGAVDEAIARRSGDPVPVYRHNAGLAASGFGGSLLNNCGELIGVNRPDPGAGGLFRNTLREPEGVVFASRLAVIEQRLGEWDIDYLKSDKECLSEAAAAAAAAAEKAGEAEQALLELEQAKRREQELATAAAAALEAGDASRADAEDAQRQAAAAVEAAEARRQAAEEDAEAARQAATAESERLQTMLSDSSEERERLERQSRTVVVTASVAAALLAILVALLWFRNRRKNRLVALATARTEAAERELEQTRAGALPDLMLEGSDDEGERFGLKIPGSSLHAGLDGVVVGRSPGRAVFVLDHPSISRAHCRLRPVGGVLHVEDLRATNGVLLNGDTLHPEESRPLREGDRLMLGTVELTLRFL